MKKQSTGYARLTSELWWDKIKTKNITPCQLRMITLLLDIQPLWDPHEIVQRSLNWKKRLRYELWPSKNYKMLAEFDFEAVFIPTLEATQPQKHRFVSRYIRGFNPRLKREEYATIVHLHGLVFHESGDFRQFENTIRETPPFHLEWSLLLSNLWKSKSLEDNVKSIAGYSAKRTLRYSRSDLKHFHDGMETTQFGGRLSDRLYAIHSQIYNLLENNEKGHSERSINTGFRIFRKTPVSI